jgi:hypothetical protein
LIGLVLYFHKCTLLVMSSKETSLLYIPNNIVVPSRQPTVSLHPACRVLQIITEVHSSSREICLDKRAKVIAIRLSAVDSPSQCPFLSV